MLLRLPPRRRSLGSFFLAQVAVVVAVMNVEAVRRAVELRAGDLAVAIFVQMPNELLPAAWRPRSFSKTHCRLLLLTGMSTTATDILHLELFDFDLVRVMIRICCWRLDTGLRLATPHAADKIIHPAGIPLGCMAELRSPGFRVAALGAGAMDINNLAAQLADGPAESDIDRV